MRELVSSGRLICRCPVVFLALRLFSFVSFSSLAFTEAATFRSIVLRSSILCSMRPDSHKCCFLFFFPFFPPFFCFFGDAAFSEYFCTITGLSLLYGKYVVHFTPSGWCLKKNQNAPRPSEHPCQEEICQPCCDRWLDYYPGYVTIESIKNRRRGSR